MQNSEIAKLPRGLLKKTDLWKSQPGVVDVSDAGDSIVVHHSPIVAFRPGADVVMSGGACPTCDELGRAVREIPYDPTLPRLSGTF